jgi:glucose 1-dehydrogenase
MKSDKRQVGVVVTGAGRGIGYAIAERFVQDGARVLLVDRDEKALRTAAVNLGQPWMSVDVSSRDSVEAMIQYALTELTEIDVLVNNAGIFRQTSLLEVSEQEFDEVLAVNLKSVLFGIQAIAPHMMARRSGAIVNIASIAATLASPGTAAYCASKAGVAQLTTAAAVELAPYGIRVNAVGPGTISTEMAVSAYGDAKANRTMLSRVPMGRSGEPSEIAGVVAFLGGPDSSYMTGKILYVDGGRLGLNLTMPLPPE